MSGEAAAGVSAVEAAGVGAEAVHRLGMLLGTALVLGWLVRRIAAARRRCDWAANRGRPEIGRAHV